MFSIKLIFKKAPFSATMTVGSFTLFLFIYWSATFGNIQPHYFQALVFLMPVICFGVITYYTQRGDINVLTASIISFVLIFVLGTLMSIIFSVIEFNEVIKDTTDINKYQRVLKISNYPNNRLINDFPKEIPMNAKDIIFRYNPAFLQGGENFDLKFTSDEKLIEAYDSRISEEAIWTGRIDTNDKTGKNINSFCSFKIFDYDRLPHDFIIYYLGGKSYSDNWNHGYIKLVAISKKREQIIFHSEEW